MTRLPRDLSGKDLAARLGKYGYRITRQVGSNIRLTTEENGTHHLTIPDHDHPKIGTLSNILKSVADHCKTTKEEIIAKLF